MRNKHLHTGFVLTLVVAVCMAMGSTTARAKKYEVYSVVGKAYAVSYPHLTLPTHDSVLL